MLPTTETCPQCGTEMPVNTSYVTWCNQCEWNIDPDVEKKKKKLTERFFENVGKVLTDDLCERLQKDPSYKSPLNLSKTLAFLMATLIHGVGLFLIYLGIKTFWNIPPLISLLLIAAGLVFMPRIPRIKSMPVLKEAFPELFDTMKQVTDALGSKEIDAVYLSSDFNAFYTRAFVKGSFGLKRVLCIGLPLFYILEPQERIALIAHEIAHGVNKDVARGIYVGTALNTLRTWYQIIAPEADQMDMGLILLSKTLLLIPRLVVFFLFATLSLLCGGAIILLNTMQTS